MMLDTVFSEPIQLQISKRLTNPEDRETMYKMCHDLLHERKSIKSILKEATLKQIEFSELKKSAFKYPHICALQNTSSKIDNLAMKLLKKTNDGNYKIGEELIGVKSYACRSQKRISSSDSYIVEKIEGDFLTLMASDGTERVLPISRAVDVLKRGFSRTCHSTQGISLGSKIYNHDIGTFMCDYTWC
jgi:hypothetical protein